jgi:hypothetical protein
LTFDEVNKALPSEVNNPEQIEEVISIFDQLDINIVDSDKDARTLDAMAAEPDDTPDADLELTEKRGLPGLFLAPARPVRMYLRERGAVPFGPRRRGDHRQEDRERRDGRALRPWSRCPWLSRARPGGRRPAHQGASAQGRGQDHREDDPSEDERTAPAVIFLLEESGHLPQERKIYFKLDSCACLSRRSTASRRRSWSTRTRWWDCCGTSSSKRRLSTGSSDRGGLRAADAQLPARSLGLHPVRGQVPVRDPGAFRQAGPADINPVWPPTAWA